jgi:protein-S-isoprenylcysteine O-methyltransferase Ste14
MRALELKIPPPVVALACAALMWLAAQTTPSLAWPEAPRTAIALTLAGAGIVVDLAGLATFVRARTTIIPWRPAASSALVTSGVYRLTRNPMYVGLALQLIAWAFYLANPLAVLGIPALVLYLTRFQIMPEERVLARLFGAEYAAYRARVRRWL